MALFFPPFSTIRDKGAIIAFAKINAPINSSSFKYNFAQCFKLSAKCTKVHPPPGTIPSSTAARVALIASSRRNFLSFISVSVTAPTLIKATPPDNLAIRFCNCSIKKPSSIKFNCFLSFSQCCWTWTLVPSLIIVVVSFVITTRRATPSCSNCRFSIDKPFSSVTTSPLVKIPISSRIGFRR